jgi:hypothetical protein
MLLQVAAMLSQAGPARKVSSSQANGAEAVPEEDSVFEGEVLYVSGAPRPLSSTTDGTSPAVHANGAYTPAVLINLFHPVGEESVEQIGSRAERMGLLSNSNIFLYSATRMDVRRRSHAVQYGRFAILLCLMDASSSCYEASPVHIL